MPNTKAEIIFLVETDERMGGISMSEFKDAALMWVEDRAEELEEGIWVENKAVESVACELLQYASFPYALGFSVV